MEGSNQEEPTKISKENTYTYWVDKDKQNNANITKKEPQKIDPSKIQSQNQENKHVSQWNQSGTWEEKKLDIKQAKDILQQQISQNQIQSNDKCIEFYEVSEVTGDISLVTVRGKKKPGYHVQIEIKYKGIGKYAQAEGLFKYTSFTDDGDRYFEIQPKNDNYKEICVKSAQNSDSLLESFILSAFEKIV